MSRMQQRPLTCDPDNVIQLWTRNGPCEIHLLSGDITQHPVDDKMDIIMVSAFPGDYAPMTGTVLGALNQNLGIHVGNMSYDKELDLRHHFSCWLSKPITEAHSPFKKLLCFERRRTEMTIAQQISEMFCVFTPVFNNQDHTVITPLLATGHQGFNKGGICRTMVDAAAHWITAGLPLRCLKIVVYEGISEDVKKNFQEMKQKYLERNQKLKERIFTKKFDVFIFFDPIDKQHVDTIMKNLKKNKADLKIYSEKAQFDEAKVWQDKIFKNMVSSKRIIAVLSTSFLESRICKEQYNMAVCCSRLVGADVLAPFYIESVKSLPTYMGLVQWIDCRVRKEGETSEQKIQLGCNKLLQALDSPEGAASQTRETIMADSKGDKYQYDVFISYSHKNPKQAETMLETFKTFNKNVKVFYDRSSLTTGSNWQNMLYRCMGQCRCVIALMSPDYLASTICMEEYSLALARYISQHKGMMLIPISVEKLDSVPPYVSQVPITDASSTNIGITATRMAEMVCRWLEKQPDEEKQSQEDNKGVEGVFCELRTKELEKQYSVVVQKKERTFTRKKPLAMDTSQNPSTDGSQVDVALIYANDSIHLAGTFCSILDAKYPELNISVHTKQGDHKRLEALDKAKHVVIFVSQEFLGTEQQMQELHLSLCRQRQSADSVIYLVKSTALRGQPFFPRIFPYDVACTDPIWEKFELDYFGHKKDMISKMSKTDRLQHASRYTCSYAEFFAMTKAAEDILEFLTKPSEERPNKPAILMNVLANDLDLHGKVTLSIPTALPILEEQAIQNEVAERKKADEEAERQKKEEGNTDDNKERPDNDEADTDPEGTGGTNKKQAWNQSVELHEKGNVNGQDKRTEVNENQLKDSKQDNNASTPKDNQTGNNKTANVNTPHKKTSSTCDIL